ncbi:MAG: PIG-L family deacetylase [Firmicutes bacterium]|jgi:LmbE family N-acetylglucosaminyl deacetylase|uniref:PIG-L family deacetylase n=1 Tax=Sulfobacillus benefaciens TaxID=453960 RepID=A0A2T2X717_9FIRM|nr:PIG-L family deacetylase [Bacillota bacterium]PSR30246.1 MAG: PIG-L family deacetylase [Sulfobacillus benefaciens]HBQ96575.1 PIG-L family deacetylase [Sulfobacillus sp.]
MARIMVIAPHPDDEGLGAGGMIYREAHKGDDVRVVFITAGDGFVQDAERYYLLLHVTPEEYLHLGYERQLEAQHAMEHLGLNSDDVMCLGFPDGGLDYLLLHFDEADPFKSPTTGETFVPYINIPTYKIPYTGRNLVELLCQEFRMFRPDILITPLLVDQHPDHWATSAFATLALLQCQSEGLGWAKTARHYGYLVHWTGWPLPLGYHPELMMEPPPALKSYPLIAWRHEHYREEVVEAKRQSLLTHDSQVELIKPFLQAFARRSEIFGQIRPLALGQKTIVPRPKTDVLAKILHRDFGLVHSEWESDGRYVRVSLDSAIRSSWRLRFADFSIGESIEFFAIEGEVGRMNSAGVAIRHGEQQIHICWEDPISDSRKYDYRLMGFVVFDAEGKLIARSGFWPWTMKA